MNELSAPPLILLSTLLGAAGGWILARTTAGPDLQLIELLTHLVERNASSAILATALVAATTMLVAVLVPVITVTTVIYAEQKGFCHDDQERYPRLGEVRGHGALADGQRVDAHDRGDCALEGQRAAARLPGRAPRRGHSRP